MIFSLSFDRIMDIEDLEKALDLSTFIFLISFLGIYSQQEQS